MLTLYQFNALEHTDRIQIVEDFGSYLEVFRRVDGCKVALFALYAFYVEVYLKQLTDTIVKLNAFSSLTRLEQYLDQVDITDAYSEL